MIVNELFFVSYIFRCLGGELLFRYLTLAAFEMGGSRSALLVVHSETNRIERNCGSTAARLPTEPSCWSAGEEG